MGLITDKTDDHTPTILVEKTRQELLLKSREASPVKAYGETRYERRTKQSPVKSIDLFNKIDMNSIFKANILSFNIPVVGESDTYTVNVLFENLCDSINREISKNGGKLEFKVIYRAIIDAINKQDIFISCTCPDFKYRIRYWSTRENFNSGQPENRPTKITNPNDTAGDGCKHVLNVISNLDWAIRLSTSIYNYIKYMYLNQEKLFGDIIYPAITKEVYNPDTFNLFTEFESTNNEQRNIDKENSTDPEPLENDEEGES